MGRPLIDLENRTFGKLKVLRKSFKVGKSWYWLCLCECGQEKDIRGSHLQEGNTVSCGCWNRDKQLVHGHKSRRLPNHSSPTYTTWMSLFARCEDSSNPQFHNYGGRGISICARWRSFENFLMDMGERPEDKSLDRIDTNGNYEPRNCRWASKQTQARNTRGRVNHSSQFKGVVKCMAKWRARIRVDGKLICLGLHKDEVEAALAYDNAAYLAWGEDAFLNFKNREKKDG